MSETDRLQYIDTWLDMPPKKGKKQRKARALCPDGRYREAVVQGHDTFAHRVELVATVEELLPMEDGGEELVAVPGVLKLVLNNVVFEPDQLDPWLQKAA